MLSDLVSLSTLLDFSQLCVGFFLDVFSSHFGKDGYQVLQVRHSYCLVILLRLRKRGGMIRPGCSLGVQGRGGDRRGRFASRRPIWAHPRAWHQTLIPWSTIKAIPFSTILTPLPFSLSHIFKNTDILILLGHCPHPCYKEHKLVFKTQEIMQNKTVERKCLFPQEGWGWASLTKEVHWKGRGWSRHYYHLSSTCACGWQPDFCILNVSPE